MCRDPWTARKIIQREIAIADSIQAVRGDPRKAKLPRNASRSIGKAQPAKRARSPCGQTSAFAAALSSRSGPEKKLPHAPAKNAKAASAARAAYASCPPWADADWLLPASQTRATSSLTSLRFVPPPLLSQTAENRSATSSLRLRPVCNFQPSGPSASTSAFSTKWCTSSASDDSSHAGSFAARSAMRSSAASVCCTSSAVRIPRLHRLGPRAIHRQFIRQQPPVKRKGR